jgi:hypothetical protein
VPPRGAGGSGILCLKASKQAGNAANGQGTQSLAAGCVVAQSVDDPRQPIKRCPVHGWLLDVLLSGNDAPDVVERITVRLPRQELALIAHSSGMRSTAGDYSLQRAAGMKCLCGGRGIAVETTCERGR